MRDAGADRPVVVVKPGNAGGAKGAGRPGSSGGQSSMRREEPAGGPKPKEKPFVISKWVVKDAYEKVKANAGAAGVDGESIAAFEADLKRNLYKIWNRLSSGTYFPPPVRAVEIRRKQVGEGSSGCQPFLIGWPRPWCECIWSRRWNPCSIPTPTAIGLVVRRWMRWACAGNGAGSSTG